MRRLLLILALLPAWPVLALEFWVAPNGHDRDPGTRAKPFLTLERARDAVRLAKQQGRRRPESVTVWVRGGVYFRTNALALSAEDSGTSQAPVLWRSYAGERVRLLGARLLTGFKPLTDPTVLQRLAPDARDHVLQLNLAQLGITNFGQLKSRGFSRPTSTAHGELFFDHAPMTLARWPNEGQFARIAGYPADSDRQDEHGGKLGQLEGGFFYPGDRPGGWADLRDVWVHGYWAYDWANSYEKVASLDPARHLVKTAPPYGLYGFRKGQRFYFLNILEELDQPGEWYLDHASGLLYFWPPAPLDNAGQPAHQVLFSILDQPLLRLVNVSCVTFRGFALEGTRGNGIEIRGGQGDRIAGCYLRDLGNHGVVIEGGLDQGVVSCDILDTGDGGVTMTGGDRQSLTPGGHFVENCHFQRQGRWTKCYVPAISMTGVGLRASHNLIEDHPHCAILFWGNDHLIEFNEIHHIALETGDVGAIYSGRDYSFRGNRIRYNFIHHTGGVGMGSMGVYMDDCLSGTEVFGNIFYKVHWAMFIGGGRDHRVENNLFVDCDPAVRVDGRGLDNSAVWRDMVDQTMRQRLAEVPAELYRQRYPDLKTLDPYYGEPGGRPVNGQDFTGVPPENNLIARNVCVGKWLETGWHAVPKILHLDQNLTNAVTSLLRAPNDQSTVTEFQLKRNSPAWALGFQRIPVEQIGLQSDGLRNDLNRLFGTSKQAVHRPVPASGGG